VCCVAGVDTESAVGGGATATAKGGAAAAVRDAIALASNGWMGGAWRRDASDPLFATALDEAEEARAAVELES
jgi:hypothetical protein